MSKNLKGSDLLEFLVREYSKIARVSEFQVGYRPTSALGHVVFEAVKENPQETFSNLANFIEVVDTTNFRKNSLIASVSIDGTRVLKLLENREDVNDYYVSLQKALQEMLAGIHLGNRTLSVSLVTVPKSTLRSAISKYGNVNISYMFSKLLENMLHVYWYVDNKKLKTSTKFSFVDVFANQLVYRLNEDLSKESPEDWLDGKGIFLSMYEFSEKVAIFYLDCLKLVSKNRTGQYLNMSFDFIVSPNGDGVGSSLVRYAYRDYLEKGYGDNVPELGFSGIVVGDLIKKDVPMNYLGQVILNKG